MMKKYFLVGNEIQAKGYPNYDAWLHCNFTNRCNLNCQYCFYNPTKHTEKLKKIKIHALLKTLDKTKKIFKIHFTGGGEPFLVPNIIEACKRITKKHYVAFNTNLSSEKIPEFCNKINPKRVVHIIASLHIDELERLKLLDKFISNFKLCKKKRFRIFACEVAYPPLAVKAKRYKEYFKKKGIKLKFMPFCGKYKKKSYPKSYTKKEIKIFELNSREHISNDLQRFNSKGKRCNAGYNVGVVFPNGSVFPCYGMLKKNMGNVYKKIKFSNEMRPCPFRNCACPFYSYDSYLFEKSKG